MRAALPGLFPKHRAFHSATSLSQSLAGFERSTTPVSSAISGASRYWE
jgi:hypothetical protein